MRSEAAIRPSTGGDPLALNSAATLGIFGNETPECRTLPQISVILALLIAILVRHIGIC